MAKIPKIIEPIDADFDDLAGSLMSTTTPVSTKPEITEKSDFLFYSTGQGSDTIRVFVAGEDVWVTQAAMAEIFGTTKQNISKHIKNIFAEGELIEESVVNKMLTTALDGKSYNVLHYNLDAILSVGYRVNSRKAIQFRRWSNTILKEYLIKGFAMDDKRLKQGNQLFGKDYFDELLERIRDIRASEKRFYQKVVEVYVQCSHDYDKGSELTQNFFAHAQNKLEYAVTGKTAAGLISDRSDHKKPNMGLTSWKNQEDGGKVRQGDVIIAKNYLDENEISELNLLVTSFLDRAELIARRGQLMSMKDWHIKLDEFLTFNEYPVLNNLGKIKSATAQRKAKLEYKRFKPIQDSNFENPDFDEAVEQIKTGKLPSS